MSWPAASGVRATPGLGIDGAAGGHAVAVGSATLLASRGLPLPAELNIASGGVFVIIDGRVAGRVALADRPRSNAREALELLRAAGVRRIVMLTGDEPGGGAAGGDARWAWTSTTRRSSPIRSTRPIEALRARWGSVAMVGDGVNDAPALAAADVGVAMGAVGSDVALETADVALMSDELLKLPFALRLARATLWNVKTNVAVSLALKAVFLVAAITGNATLWMAVLADTGASVIVVANALRLLRAR